jgi:hypothetical protein
MPPCGPVPEGPYSAVLRRVVGGFQKLIVPEVVIAGLSKKRARAVWKFWGELGPASWRKDLDAQT